MQFYGKLSWLFFQKAPTPAFSSSHLILLSHPALSALSPPYLLLPQRVVHDVEVGAGHEQDRELMGALHNFVMDRQPALPVPCHAGQHVARVLANHVAAVVRLERARCLVLLRGVDRRGGGRARRHGSGRQCTSVDGRLPVCACVCVCVCVWNPWRGRRGRWEGGGGMRDGEEGWG